MGDAAKRTEDLPAQGRALAIDPHRDLTTEIAITPEDRDAKWHAFGQLTVELHIAIQTNAADDPMTCMGILPEGVAVLAHFLVL